MTTMTPRCAQVNFPEEGKCGLKVTTGTRNSDASVRDIIAYIWGHPDHLNLDVLMRELELRGLARAATAPPHNKEGIRT